MFVTSHIGDFKGRLGAGWRGASWNFPSTGGSQRWVLQTLRLSPGCLAGQTRPCPPLTFLLHLLKVISVCTHIWTLICFQDGDVDTPSDGCINHTLLSYLPLHRFKGLAAPDFERGALMSQQASVPQQAPPWTKPHSHLLLLLLPPPSAQILPQSPERKLWQWLIWFMNGIHGAAPELHISWGGTVVIILISQRKKLSQERLCGLHCLISLVAVDRDSGGSKHSRTACCPYGSNTWAFLSQEHLEELLISLDGAHCSWDPATCSCPVGFIYWAQDSPQLHWLLAWKWTRIKSEPMGEENLPRLLERDLAVSSTLHQWLEVLHHLPKTQSLSWGHSAHWGERGRESHWTRLPGKQLPMLVLGLSWATLSFLYQPNKWSRGWDCPVSIFPFRGFAKVSLSICPEFKILFIVW